jgi:hypothetical protein
LQEAFSIMNSEDFDPNKESGEDVDIEDAEIIEE